MPVPALHAACTQQLMHPTAYAPPLNIACPTAPAAAHTPRSPQSTRTHTLPPPNAHSKTTFGAAVGTSYAAAAAAAASAAAASAGPTPSSARAHSASSAHKSPSERSGAATARSGMSRWPLGSRTTSAAAPKVAGCMCAPWLHQHPKPPSTCFPLQFF